MQIYLLRHGIAEEGNARMRDEDRALTSEGRKRLKEVLKVAQEAGVDPQVIVTSPLLRAMQTAELAAESLGYKEVIFTSSALVPESSPQEVWEEIRLHRDANEVLLASHEPLLSSAIAFLLDAPTLQVDVKKGSLTRIDVERLGPKPNGILKWMLTPAVSR
jgi:phosphohistidine phosphatase